jgi:hypothetical protein
VPDKFIAIKFEVLNIALDPLEPRLQKEEKESKSPFLRGIMGDLQVLNTTKKFSDIL